MFYSSLQKYQTTGVFCQEIQTDYFCRPKSVWKHRPGTGAFLGRWKLMTATEKSCGFQSSFSKKKGVYLWSCRETLLESFNHKLNFLICFFLTLPINCIKQNKHSSPEVDLLKQLGRTNQTRLVFLRFDRCKEQLRWVWRPGSSVNSWVGKGRSFLGLIRFYHKIRSIISRKFD